MIQLQGELQQKISSGEKDFEILRSISLIAEALKIEHGLELLESQGIIQLHNYLSKIQQEATTSTVKAVKNLAIDSNFKSALHLAEELVKNNIEHPKIPKLKELILEQMLKQPDSKIIIFTQFRGSAEEIVKLLTSMNIKNNIFLGQAKKNGLGFSQKQQKEILDRFRAGGFNVLIATSVAEEGLDIPRVDKVIFYEPVPSAIRSIQRRGRTGRLEKGEVTVLVTKGTRDEAYRWSAHHKEKKMHRHLQTLKTQFAVLKKELELGKKVESAGTLERFIDPSPTITEHKLVTILADHREKDNKVVKELMELNVSVKTAQLESADYILSGNLAVELKKVPDFVDSLLDGRLLEQMKKLKQHFAKAVLIIEGEEDIYAQRKVHPHSIRGMIACIVLDFGIPILYTKNPKETASLFAIMARREQEKGSDVSLHERKPHTIEELQEYFVGSLPNVGYKTAKVLLLRFGSVRGLVNASKEELMTVEGIGEKMAGRLVELFGKEYGKGK